MNTTSRILATIAAINGLRPASQHLRAEVHGMSDTAGLQEFYIVEDVSGQVAALGYSEADLLANLQKLEAAGVRQ